MRDAGEEAHQARDRDHGPAHAFRLQQDGVHLVDLGRHPAELGLHVGDLLLEDGETFGRRGTGGAHARPQMVLAIFSSERPPTYVVTMAPDQVATSPVSASVEPSPSTLSQTITFHM